MSAIDPAPGIALRTPFGAVASADPTDLHIAETPESCTPLLDHLTPPSPGTWRGLYLSFEACCAVAGIAVPAADPIWGAAGAVWTGTWPDQGQPQWQDLRAQWDIGLDVDTYRDRFVRLQNAIRAGEIYQLNLTVRARARSSSAALVPSRDAAPCAGILCLPEAGLHLVSQSPECLLELDGTGLAISRPIKGTCSQPDQFPALRLSSKEQAEHTMVVDMTRNDLGRVCLAGSVQVSRRCAPLVLPYATHMVSDVQGRLRDDISVADALRALLPGASVTGTPKIRACQIIAELEQMPRGPYTGILGAMFPDGRAFFSLLIRTAWRDRAGDWWYGTGGGIVADSDCDAEYAELLLKTQPVRSASRAAL